MNACEYSNITEAHFGGGWSDNANVVRRGWILRFSSHNLCKVRGQKYPTEGGGGGYTFSGLQP